MTAKKRMAKSYYIFFLFLPIILSVIFLAIKQKTVLELCEINKCPFCYGKTMCREITKNKISLQYNRVSDFVYNIFSVKNVYFAKYKNKPVVLKKLAHNNELNKFDKDIKDKIINYKELKDNLKFKLTGSDEKLTFPPFHICDNETFDIFFDKLNDTNIRTVYTILSINAEPILLEMFDKNKHFPVPKFYGSCGRLIVQENFGKSVNNIEKYSWYKRALVAYRILRGVQNFTENHNEFRLYLTDISPDNVVIDENLDVSIIDMENAILKRKTGKTEIVHHTNHDIDEYAFDPKAICESDISDHNIYAVCRLLLSKNAMFPMMEGGLLHNPPKEIMNRYWRLFESIELCVRSTTDDLNRFDLSTKILNKLHGILRYAKAKQLI
ncbi:divergent protein kinase domain 2A-like isoform X1 [Diorhabda sublineata]|uniref:divergent protein kinase domain 2A-like isoform X1 n=1 Tax=Diorhabda sublineata TaxID=1163346 RepID=UPI0024E0B3EE|nr:divergent protein kinase domain 2A-like isoform X1 [Diorhabda sublineata]XP_056635488.1 divergent protein kinase domain 2A-like isoform X1 [Diorhabda sublineata]XP_056635489.1 divergent protein kinase domain 2A-like isoform X1 [Diorhabda sublineata]